MEPLWLDEMDKWESKGGWGRERAIETEIEREKEEYRLMNTGACMRRDKEINKQIWQRLRRNNLKCMKRVRKEQYLECQRKGWLQKELVKLRNHWLRQLIKHEEPSEKEFFFTVDSRKGTCKGKKCVGKLRP